MKQLIVIERKGVRAQFECNPAAEPGRGAVGPGHWAIRPWLVLLVPEFIEVSALDTDETIIDQVRRRREELGRTEKTGPGTLADLADSMLKDEQDRQRKEDPRRRLDREDLVTDLGRPPSE